MKHVTEEKLAKLRAEVDREYGKLVQKLLAAAFLETGVEKLFSGPTTTSSIPTVAPLTMSWTVTSSWFT